MDEKCELCGEPMPKGEEMFKFHGYSGPCPKPPLTPPPASIEHGPFAVMAGAPWNVLDSRGVRIAICGGDSPADWAQHGPPVAAAIVEALNAAKGA